MREDGYYAIYKGREYRLGFNSKLHVDMEHILTSRKEQDVDMEFILTSCNEEDADRGFIKDKRGIYSKTVKKEELETVFSIERWCQYGGGHEFQITAYMEEDDAYEIVCVNIRDPVLIKVLGFTLAESGVYKKVVKSEELNSIYEVKRVFLDF